MKNPVARNMHKFNRPQVVLDKRNKYKDDDYEQEIAARDSYTYGDEDD